MQHDSDEVASHKHVARDQVSSCPACSLLCFWAGYLEGLSSPAKEQTENKTLT